MDDFLAEMCDTPGAAAEPEGESDMLTMGDVMGDSHPDLVSPQDAPRPASLMYFCARNWLHESPRTLSSAGRS